MEDIVTPPGDKQDFVLEVPIGTLNAPDDILFDSGSPYYPVTEIPQTESTSATVSF